MRVSIHVSTPEQSMGIQFLLVESRTSSIERLSTAIRFCEPATTVCFARVQDPHNHSFSSTVTTSLSIGGLWQYW